MYKIIFWATIILTYNKLDQIQPSEILHYLTFITIIT